MKCALVIPAWRPEEVFPTRTAASQVNYWEPLGTLYVAACLRCAGHEVQFFNGAFLSHQQIVDRLRRFAPALVGLYSTTFGWPKAIHAARAIKAINSDIVICTGGPHPIAEPVRCLREAGDAIDVVVSGEGEITVVEVARRVAAGRTLRGVAGTVVREAGQIICNSPRPLIEDLDSIPFPARDLLGDIHRYVPPPATYRRKPVAVVMTSRGCNRRCIFCAQMDRERRFGVRGVRYRSVDNVLDEIEQCLALGYREIKFIDDSFAADPSRALQLTRGIKARGLDFTWFASACVNQVDYPLLRAMRDAGCWSVLLGAESGVQKNLNTLRKGITLAQTRKAVRAAKDAELSVSTPFLFGIPGETWEDGLKTIEFALELNPDLANFHALTPFPGTHLHQNLDKYGTASRTPCDYTYQGAAFTPHTLSRTQIQELRQLAFRRFYSRPSFLLRRLLQVRSWNDCRAAYRGVRSLFWLWAKRRLFERGAPPSTDHSVDPSPDAAA
ncbi:MAG: cobalamin-dependent protein [Pseudomonadota bacterium]|nr:MAG: cobalamin-dependent protein [Pseudomonadota bacterium]